MIWYLRYTARGACALFLVACGEERIPTAPAVDSTIVVASSSSSYSAMEPSPEDYAGMPPEFSTAPTILSGRTVVGFTADGAYAQGLMEYFGTDAEQDVTLYLKLNGSEIDSRTARGAREDFLPALRSLTTSVSIPLSVACGHSAEGQSAHKAWHKFIVSGWKFLSWGREAKSSGDHGSQGVCPVPPPETPENNPGGGDDGDPYETGCLSCQQWFWYENGEMVDEWWECEPTPSYRCEFRES